MAGCSRAGRRDPCGDTSGRECPRSEQIRQQPNDVSELHGTPGSPCVGVCPEVAGSVLPVVLEGQYAAVGMLSPSDCYPAGPVGPCVAASPVGSDDYLQVLEPLEHSVLDHVDPAGQHGDVQDTVESLEHSVLDYILELLENTLKLLDTTLDGGLVEKISDWEPAAHPVPDASLDGRPMEGTTTLEHSVLVESLDSRPTEGMLSLEPLEQSVLNTLLVAQPTEGSMETTQPERSALASQLDYGHLNLESLVRPMLDVALDRG